ncbi:Carbohydrate-binding WSC-containing protein [Venustampulla echinocandica]|uniref:Carbohydrate-binding WSC-containing protein n=1 Tax=Venustampulla echinocandica TaxID=2656787 RepID=A0A370TBR3_9HELO|nr:Carbohydrate-binding WSC-containing protein [Venustampulla echinocandica]RDL31498.1 Carbohydrate-binding WSC-containing protein [Venustampulla echinocandica]
MLVSIIPTLFLLTASLNGINAAPCEPDPTTTTPPTTTTTPPTDPTGCTSIPPGTLPNTITTGFAIQVQNASYPIIHNRYMNLWASGGGDQHLFLSPAGDAAADLKLDNGVITRLPIRAVINGEYTPEDNTTKMFMTDRGDPRAIYDVVYGCSPSGQVQKELRFKARDTLLGGHICVRLTSGDRYEFRYSPPGNTATDRLCIKVTLAIL